MAFQFGPWSDYVQVEGITTPPATPTSTSAPLVPGGRRLILIFTLVPVGALLLVATVVVMFVLFGWYRRR